MISKSVAVLNTRNIEGEKTLSQCLDYAVLSEAGKLEVNLEPSWDCFRRINLQKLEDRFIVQSLSWLTVPVVCLSADPGSVVAIRFTGRITELIQLYTLASRTFNPYSTSHLFWQGIHFDCDSFWYNMEKIGCSSDVVDFPSPEPRRPLAKSLPQQHSYLKV